MKKIFILMIFMLFSSFICFPMSASAEIYVPLTDEMASANDFVNEINRLLQGYNGVHLQSPNYNIASSYENFKAYISYTPSLVKVIFYERQGQIYKFTILSDVLNKLMNEESTSIFGALGITIGMTPDELDALTDNARQTGPNVIEGRIFCAKTQRIIQYMFVVENNIACWNLVALR